MNSQKAEALINAICQEAEAKWGEQWIAALTRTYCEIETTETGKPVKSVDRRSQIERIIRTKAATLSTLIRLIQAIDGEIEIFIKKPLPKGIGYGAKTHRFPRPSDGDDRQAPSRE